MIFRAILIATVLAIATVGAQAATRTVTINSSTGDLVLDPIGTTFQIELPAGAFAPDSSFSQMAIVGHEIPTGFNLTNSVTSGDYPFTLIHNVAGRGLFTLEFTRGEFDKIFIKLNEPGLFDIGPPNDLPDGTDPDAVVWIENGAGNFVFGQASVTIGSLVPEPSSLGLLGFGILGVFGACRRTRRG